MNPNLPVDPPDNADYLCKFCLEYFRYSQVDLDIYGKAWVCMQPECLEAAEAETLANEVES